MIDCDASREAAIAYATAGLGADEARQLLEHLAGCPDCYAYLREVSRVLQLLPYGLPPVTPPDHLRARVLAAIRREQAPGDAAAAAPGADRARSGAAGATDRLIAGLRRLALPAAAGVLLAVLGGLAWSDLRQDRLLAERLAAGDDQLRAAITLLGEGPVRPLWTAALSKEERFPSSWGHVTLYDTRYGMVMVLAAGGLPELQPEQVYRVWLLAEGARTDGGSFRPDAAGFGALIVQQGSFPFDGIGITLEPDSRQVPGPRGPRVLFGELAAGPER